MENYRVGNLIGGGGMADVYYAMHVGLDRPVAMKVMKAWLAGDEEFVARFQREARICARMAHENIVQVYDMGTKNGRPYLVMELLQGETLRQRMKKIGAIPEDEAIGIVKQVLAGLAYAHEQAGIIHRDIKPGNVFLCQTGVVKVMDFGIARAAAETRLTQTNAQLGTPEYMAPEQVEGKNVDARSDLYALGVMLYEMLTGDVPFKADTPLAVLHQQVTKQPPPLPDRFSPGLRAVVNKTLVKDPAGRYASAHEMLEALERLGGGGRKGVGGNSFAVSRKATVAVATVLGLAALAGLGYGVMKNIPIPGLTRPKASPAAPAKKSAAKPPQKASSNVRPAVASVNVPSLRGLSLSRAEDALRDAGLKVGDVDREYNSSVGSGEIVRQEPGAGDDVSRGRTVDLVVSRGSRPAPADPTPEPARRPEARSEARQERREARREAVREAVVARRPAAPRPAAPKPPASRPASNPGGGGRPDIDF